MPTREKQIQGHHDRRESKFKQYRVAIETMSNNFTNKEHSNLKTLIDLLRETLKKRIIFDFL